MTTEPMTPERLDEIQARVDAVGPVQPVRHGTAPYEVYDSTGHESGKMGGYMTHGSPREVDAEFITHAYTDVPALLAEVERLRTNPTVTDDMVERAARAMSSIISCGSGPWESLSEVTRDIWLQTSRAALNAAYGDVTTRPWEAR